MVDQQTLDADVAYLPDHSQKLTPRQRSSRLPNFLPLLPGTPGQHAQHGTVRERDDDPAVGDWAGAGGAHTFGDVSCRLEVVGTQLAVFDSDRVALLDPSPCHLRHKVVHSTLRVGQSRRVP